MMPKHNTADKALNMFNIVNIGGSVMLCNVSLYLLC